jgi:hypothetical protein
MRRRSLFGALAIAMVASIAFGPPSQAGPVTTVTANLTLDPFGSNETLSSVVVTFSSAAAPFDNLVLNVPPTDHGSTISSNAMNYEVTVVPSDSAVGAYQILGEAVVSFTFTVNLDLATAESTVTTSSSIFNTGGGPVNASASNLSYSQIVPEPASLTIMGIGVAGALVFGRSFYRSNARRKI